MVSSAVDLMLQHVIFNAVGRLLLLIGGRSDLRVHVLDGFHLRGDLR